MSRKSTIAIIEDNHDFRENLERYIFGSRQLTLVGSYDSAESAWQKLTSICCDILLVDIGLPGMSGVEFITRVRDKFPKIQAIVISVFDDHQTIFDALKAGAIGYLSKNIRQEDLSSSIETVLKGGAPMSPAIARKVVTSFELNRDSPLSEKETRVLDQLAKGLSYTQIAEQLYVSSETIKTHIKNIYRKLEVNSKSEAIQLAQTNKFI